MELGLWEVWEDIRAGGVQKSFEGFDCRGIDHLKWQPVPVIWKPYFIRFPTQAQALLKGTCNDKSITEGDQQLSIFRIPSFRSFVELDLEEPLPYSPVVSGMKLDGLNTSPIPGGGATESLASASRPPSSVLSRPPPCTGGRSLTRSARFSSVTGSARAPIRQKQQSQMAEKRREEARNLALSVRSKHPELLNSRSVASINHVLR